MFRSARRAPTPTFIDAVYPAINDNNREAAQALLAAYLDSMRMENFDKPTITSIHKDDEAAAGHLVRFLGKEAMAPLLIAFNSVLKPPFMHSAFPYAFGRDGEQLKQIYDVKIDHAGILMRYFATILEAVNDPTSRDVLDRQQARDLFVGCLKAKEELAKVSRFNVSLSGRGHYDLTDAAYYTDKIHKASEAEVYLTPIAKMALEQNFDGEMALLSSAAKAEFLIAEFGDALVPEALRLRAREAMPQVFTEIAGDPNLLPDEKLGLIKKVYYLLAKDGGLNKGLPTQATKEAALNAALQPFWMSIDKTAASPDQAKVEWAKILQEVFFWPHLRREGTTFPDLFLELARTYTAIRLVNPELGLLMEGRFLVQYAGNDKKLLDRMYKRFSVHLHRPDDPLLVARVGLKLLPEAEGTYQSDDHRTALLEMSVRSALREARPGTNHPEIAREYFRANRELLATDCLRTPVTATILAEVTQRYEDQAMGIVADRTSSAVDGPTISTRGRGPRRLRVLDNNGV